MTRDGLIVYSPEKKRYQIYSCVYRILEMAISWGLFVKFHDCDEVVMRWKGEAGSV